MRLMIHFQIGFIGLIEEEWMETLSTIDYDAVLVENFCTAGRRLANEMKTYDVSFLIDVQSVLQISGLYLYLGFSTQNVDLVIALTHMRMANDEKLLKEVSEIDLVLGGI